MLDTNTSSILYDHYKDTCSIVGEAVKTRHRLMVFVLVILGFFAFQGIFPSVSNMAVKDFLNFKFGLASEVDLSILGNLVWFLLLIFSLRYFQIAIFVERQQTYLHEIEDKLNKKLGEEVVTREGKSYLSNYPGFSNWMWSLYTIIFPLLLLLITVIKIAAELRNSCIYGWSTSLLLNITAFLLLTPSVILYLITLHKKKR